MSESRSPKAHASSTYYPSQHRGHQCLILDDRNVIGAPDRPPRFWGA